MVGLEGWVQLLEGLLRLLLTLWHCEGGKAHSANLYRLARIHAVDFTGVHSRLEIMATPTL